MDPDLTIILLGNTGVGKSASGNTILGCEAFESGPSLKSLTTEICEATEIVFEKQISVIDTPGIVGQEKEIRTWCQEFLQSDRPCLFLVVVSVGRFTDEQERALNATIKLVKDLDTEWPKKSFLLFTNGDALKKMSLDDFIFEDEEGFLPDSVKEFWGRYHLFNNVNGGQEQVRELLEKSSSNQRSTAASSGDSVRLEEVRIVLLGLSGSGKSSSGNTILGSDKFKLACDFDSDSRENVSESATVGGRQVKVVDTPGFTDEDLTPKQLYKEIMMKSILDANPGPHAFIIVVKIGRMSRKDSDLLQVLAKMFGSDAPDYTMVVFTHGDELGGQSIDQKIQSNTQVSELVSKCKNRYCVFDNKGRKSRRQIQKLMSEIDDMVTANRGQHFTSDMFKMAKTFIDEAERTSDHRASRETAQRRLEPFVARSWRTSGGLFTALCPCCCSGDSDDERRPLIN